jgi:hypothetical protein
MKNEKWKMNLELKVDTPLSIQDNRDEPLSK